MGVVDDKKIKVMESEIDDLKREVVTLKREKSTLQREKEELSTSASRQANKPMTFESAKAAESTAELRRAKEKLTEYEDKLYKIEKEKNGLNVKVRELESV